MNKISFVNTIMGVYKETVISPSNPFTIDNPDLLIFNGHQLLGLFFPLKKETNNPDLLLRRLYLSRLTLYSDMRCLLMINEDNRELGNKVKVIKSFDASYIYDGDKDLIHFLRQEFPLRYYIRARDKRYRLTRFWGVMEYLRTHSLINEKYQKLDGDKCFQIESWSQPNKIINPRSISFIYPDIVTSKDANKYSFKENYESLITYTMMYDYSLLEGRLIPNDIEKDSFKFLNAEILDTLISNKMNLRTLLFMGFIPGRVDSEKAIVSVRNSYFSFMKEHKYL